MNNQHAQLFHRNKLNPILTADNWLYPINSVFNAGATLLHDGTTLLLCAWKIGVDFLTFVLLGPQMV